MRGKRFRPLTWQRGSASTSSLTGRQWVVVIVLSLVSPAVVAVDKLIQLRRQGTAP